MIKDQCLEPRDPFRSIQNGRFTHNIGQIFPTYEKNIGKQYAQHIGKIYEKHRTYSGNMLEILEIFRKYVESVYRNHV